MPPLLVNQPAQFADDFSRSAPYSMDTSTQTRREAVVEAFRKLDALRAVGPVNWYSWWYIGGKALPQGTR